MGVAVFPVLVPGAFRRSMHLDIPSVLGLPIDFLLFASLLLGVAVFHHHTLRVAVLGLSVITVYKLFFSPFHGIAGGPGLLALLGHEWVVVANLFALLLGFALLSRHFEASRVPLVLPRFLADDWKGGFMLLVLVFVLSSFLDNIAAAMIGGTMASVVYKGRLHVGFLAAIVAASNAGGSGSVVGDTTTTMMSDRAVAHLSMFAEERSTWQSEPVTLNDMTDELARFEQLRLEVDAARQRSRLWLLALGVCAILITPVALVQIVRLLVSFLVVPG